MMTPNVKCCLIAQTLVKYSNINVLSAGIHTMQRLKREVKLSAPEHDGLEKLLTFPTEDSVSKTKLSSQMKKYLERAKQHEEFMKKEIVEYNIGLRHLANIMGVDANTMKETDIKKYIAYLFPSGLYDKGARPMLLHPEVAHPVKAAPPFNRTGRPHHSFFYTLQPNFSKLLHDMAHWFNTLTDLESKIIARQGVKNHTLPPNSKLIFKDEEYISKEQLESTLREKLSDQQYEYFVETVNRLIEHPLSQHAKSIIQLYVKDKQKCEEVIPSKPLCYDENGRPFVTITKCGRKSARGSVTVYGNGSGNITINGENLLYFKHLHHRDDVIFPLIFTEMGDKVDVVAEIEGGGPTGHAGTMRYGISRALLSFVDDQMKRQMKLAGLLTRDWRRRERKKIGQEGARRKFTWKKR